MAAGVDEALLAILSEAHFLPRDALARAAAEPATIAEPVLRLLERGADDPDAIDEAEANLMFWGVHAMAAARDTRLFAPLLRLLRQDEETLDGLLGDALTATIPLALSSSFDGEAGALHRFILDSSVADGARNAAFATLAFLTREGRLDRDATQRLLERFDDARIAIEESPGWFGWEEAIAYLGLIDLTPRVEAARRDGRITDEFGDMAWFRRTLKQVSATPPNLEAFEGEPYGYLDDPIAALTWTAEEAGQPVTNPYRDVGRNDPCPCGSGKKYKKCCLVALASPATLTAPSSDLH